VNLNILQKIKSTAELKTITDEAQRQAILKDAFNVQYAAVQNKDVLLIDDLYRSGETLKATAKVLLDSGKARNVYVLTITKTRAKR
jgi:predicted amidophosphoribosyltransferase